MRSAPITFALCVALFSSSSFARDKFAEKLEEQAEKSKEYLLRNISPSDGALGSVLASPSRKDPDYYFHWTRDAALVMEAVRFWQQQSDTPENVKASLLKTLKDYVGFSRKNQNTYTLTGLGEPKFYVDGRGYFEAWGRPQNDGPALRALTLVKMAQNLIKMGETGFVKTYLYNSSLPATTVIKTDLEYVAHHWRESSFDVWEEVRGIHFYNLLVTRAALLDGATLADSLGDSGASGFYRLQAELIKKELSKFFDASKGYIVATMNRTDGINYKNSNLDMVVLLGVLHAPQQDGIFGPTDDRVLATAEQIRKTFKDIYSINQKNFPGLALGRYPEDKYDGAGISTGNPWFLANHGMAELYYRMAKGFEKEGQIKFSAKNLDFFASLDSHLASSSWVGKTLKAGQPQFKTLLQKIVGAGDSYMARTLAHMNQETGEMSEQINRESGYMQGANNLTWSYASYLTAIWAR